jgi:UDP-3-O-[3-hydroxymyristoyl] glucosamine N-acyltransferase
MATLQDPPDPANPPTPNLVFSHQRQITYKKDPETLIPRGSIQRYRSQRQRDLLASGNAYEHSNGGGVIVRGAQVPSLAFVGLGAIVGETAVVGVNAKIYDKAELHGHAVDRTTIRGHAYVGENVFIRQNAIIGQNARLNSGVVVTGSVCVGGRMRITGLVQLGGAFSILGNFLLENTSDEFYSVMLGRDNTITLADHLLIYNRIP